METPLLYGVDPYDDTVFNRRPYEQLLPQEVTHLRTPRGLTSSSAADSTGVVMPMSGHPEDDRYGRLVTYEFDLVAESGELGFVERGFERARFLLSEFQPATRVSLVGTPPARIRILAQGRATEIAPGLLDDVEALAGTPLRYALLD